MAKEFTEIEAHQTAADLALSMEKQICTTIGIDEVDTLTSDAFYDLIYGLIFTNCTIRED